MTEPNDVVNPTLDQHDENTLGPSGPVFEQKAAEAFLRDNAEEWSPYANDYNTELLWGWCFARIVPVTLRNLKYAFDDLVKTKIMKPREDYDSSGVTQIAQAFAEAYPELEPYFSTKNLDRVTKYLDDNGITLSVENLHDAFLFCVSRRLIIPMDKGFPTFRKPTVAERVFKEEERRKAEALSEAGKPVSTELKRAYQASLQEKRKAANPVSNDAMKAARCAVLEENPSLDLYSAEFRAKVSEKISEYLREQE